MAKKPTYEQLEQIVRELKQSDAQHQQTEKQLRERLQAIGKIGALANSSLELTVVLNNVLKSTLQALNASAGMIFLYDANNRCLTWGASLGLSEAFVNDYKRRSIRPGEGLSGLIFQTGSPIFIPENSSHDPRIVRNVVKREGLHSFIGAPLYDVDQIVGVINILTRPPNTLRERDLDLCVAIAAQVGLSIRNAMLFDKMVKAEKSLRESEGKYRLLVENQNDLVVEFDTQKRLLFVSPSYCKTFGIDEAEMLGKTFLPLIHGEDLASVNASIESLSRPPHKTYHEERAKTVDGWRWFAWSLKALLDKAGNHSHTIAVGRDITEQKQTMDALRASEAEKQAILDASPDIMLLVDTGFRIIWANRRAAEFINKQPQELVGHTCHKVFQDSDDYCPGCPTVEAIRSEEPKKGIMYQPAMQGVGESYWEDYSVPIKDESGQIIGAVEIGRNITERKRDEAALKASEEKFSKAFQNAPLLMAIISYEDGRYLEINDAFVRLTGYSREDAIGKTSAELGLIKAEDRNKLPSLLEADGHIREHELEITCKDGSKRLCLYSGERIEYEGKTRLLSIASDITERRRHEEERERLKEQLLQIQKMESVGRLAGGVAHDFNNKLSVILGRMELILMDMKPEDPSYDSFQEIQKAAKGASDLTRQLLAFARKQTISPKRLDLNETLEGMLKMLRRLIGEDIELSWLPGKGLWPVKMDPSQIDQILANLCVNARDAITGIGRISIQTRNVGLDDMFCETNEDAVPGNYVMISVGDDGSGMDEITLDQIFEPFFTTKEPGKGTGLGLSTVYGIVKQNNGFVSVHSEPGNGSIFRIYIPTHQLEDLQHVSDHAEDLQKGSGETVLLVEDDANVLNLIRAMLERLDYRVSGAPRPEEALEKARYSQGKVHLLMTDVVMPQMSGKKLAKEMSKIQPNIQILFMSGYTADVIAHQGILDEGVNFIEKPFSMDELGRKLREILDGETA